MTNTYRGKNYLDGTLVVFKRVEEAHRPKTRRSMKVYVGKGSTAYRVHTRKWVRHGTELTIQTDAGTLVLSPGMTATWNGAHLIPLGTDEFIFVEDEEKVIAHPRR